MSDNLKELVLDQARLATCLHDLYEKMWEKRVQYVTDMQALEDSVYYTLQKLVNTNRRINETTELLCESCYAHSSEGGTVKESIQAEREA